MNESIDEIVAKASKVPELRIVLSASNGGRTLRPIQFYSFGLVVAAMVGLSALAVVHTPSTDADPLLALFIVMLIVAGRSINFRISSAASTHMGTPALLVAVLLLNPTLAVIAVGVGSILGEAIQRGKQERLLFNTGQSMIQALLALGVLYLVGWNHMNPNFESPSMLAATFAAGVMAITTSALLVSIRSRLERGGRLWPVIVEVMFGGESKLYCIDLSKVSFGLIAAMLITWTPMNVVLIIIPLATMSNAIARGLDLRQRLERALHETEASLAEAQQLANLGSWEWELSSRYMRWSEQVFEITGIESDGALVSLGDLRSLLRPPDRTKLEQAIGQLVETHGTVEFDHEVLRADGSVRHVHHVMGWAPADGRVGERLVGTMLDITERKQLELELRYQAFHDGLTGLPNREFFLERLGDYLTVGRELDREKGVIFIDLDHFKQINDRLGHETGDAVLIEVARRLERIVSSQDTVARLSGDEFTVLVCNLSHENRTATLAGELLHALQQPVHIKNESIPVTASAGIVFISDRHQTPSDVLREADKALYHAKGSGRNQLSIEPADPPSRLDKPTALRRPA